jgi:hypothetical protein
MWSKIAVAGAALLIFVSAAAAEEKHKPRHKPDQNHSGEYHDKKYKPRHRPYQNHGGEYHRKRHRGDGHNYWRGGHNNYWRGGNNNYWRGGNNNNYFYQDPNFWGGVAGGLIGGAIINQYNDAPAPYPYPYPEYQVQPECQLAWIRVYIPGTGYQSQQTLICNQ